MIYSNIGFAMCCEKFLPRVVVQPINIKYEGNVSFDVGYTKYFVWWWGGSRHDEEKLKQNFLGFEWEVGANGLIYTNILDPDACFLKVEYFVPITWIVVIIV